MANGYEKKSMGIKSFNNDKTPELLRDQQSVSTLLRSQTTPLKSLVDHRQSQRPRVISDYQATMGEKGRFPSNRYIEYKKPRRILQVEIIHLPVIRMDPRNYSMITIESIRLDLRRASELICRI